jgi:hypothetical protein
MSGFRVALPNPDAVDSWMVKNGLYPNDWEAAALLCEMTDMDHGKIDWHLLGGAPLTMGCQWKQVGCSMPMP